jgi:uncharacterized lipoprotein YajG
MNRRIVPALAAALLAAGCASGPPFIDKMEPKAVTMAESKGQFELNCPSATGHVLNRQELQPLAFGGPVRAQYTVGVAGCDKRATFDVLCSENNNQCLMGR